VAALHNLSHFDGDAQGGLPDWLGPMTPSETGGGWAPDLGWAKDFQLPAMPNLGKWAPSVGDGPSGRPTFAEGGGATTVSGAGAGTGLTWIAVLVLVGVGAWLAVSWRRKQVLSQGGSWSAGPWPVDPSRVTTREDLVRAFEHLAYLLIGPSARPLNHLDVAARLGEAGDKSGAADRLARLYEHARYAPPDESLPADDMAAARRDLGALAGAAA
jgi:hypothetical protein